jgi:hypothetical protein
MIIEHIDKYNIDSFAKGVIITLYSMGNFSYKTLETLLLQHNYKKFQILLIWDELQKTISIDVNKNPLKEKSIYPTYSK